MKPIKVLLLLLIITILSCSNDKKTIEGIWVLEDSAKAIDTVTIKKIKDNIYYIQTRYWKNEKRKVKSSTGTYQDGKLTFENGKSVEINFEEMIVKNQKYIKLKF